MMIPFSIKVRVKRAEKRSQVHTSMFGNLEDISVSINNVRKHNKKIYKNLCFFIRFDPKKKGSAISCVFISFLRVIDWPLT